MDKAIFDKKIEESVKRCEGIFEKFLPEQKGPTKTLVEAMSYSVMVGGKRLRPILMIEAYKLFAKDMGENSVLPAEIESFATAIEFIHNYSLVHDDLPAMDNDEFRRGRLTTWKVYGDGMGVLTGDALLNMAFEIVMNAGVKYSDDPVRLKRIVKASDVLFNKSGIHGMIGGQCADLEAENSGKDATLGDILYIHEHKTGCLIEASLMIGAILGGASDEEVKKMEKAGSNVGIAFQIQDDILDVIGDSEELGKQTGSDAANGKATYVTIKGIEDSEAEVKRLSKEAEELLQELPGDKEFMMTLIEALIGRRR
ncbi:MAG: polyprenyl synthetase family protein [Lachnospiraceae bacterium]|nr:polyprenyl synthetase family protein [Lachnospiraceae bacterium]